MPALLLLAFLQVAPSPSAQSHGTHPWVEALAAADLLGRESRAVAVDRDGVLWVGVVGVGLARVDSAGVTVLEAGDGLASEGVADLLERDGRLWAVGLGGAAVREGRRWRALPDPGGLGARVAFRVRPTTGGGVWLATSAGAARLGPGGVTTLTEADGLPHAVVHDVVEEPDGTVWLACRRGLARRRPDGAQEVFFPELNVRAGAQGADGVLWFGTSDGLVGWDGRRWSRQLRGRTVYPRALASGALWSGSASSGIFRLDQAGQWIPVPVPKRLEGTEVHDLAEGPGGTVWLATSAGVGVVAGPAG